ncbi:MAG: GNAT family N-acetyltransferase [Treponema sp.]|nr:GNAT family N-acetyltransferase [Treponema sp.]
MPVIIKPLLPEQGEEALLFLQPYESECVNLASEILRGGTDCWCIFYAERLQAQDSRGQKIAGSSPAMTDDAMSLTVRVSGPVNNFLDKTERSDVFPRSDNLSFPRSDAGIFQDQKLAGLIALRKKRSLFFCLPFAKYKSAFDKKVCSEAQRPLMEFFESNEPFCINGEAAGAVFLRNILKNKKTSMRPSVTNKYYLMARDSLSLTVRVSGPVNNFLDKTERSDVFPRSDAGIFQDQKIAGSNPAMTNCGLRVMQATAADCDLLLPLELGYQREEVVPDSFDISDAALAAAFKHELDQGLTFALFDGDRPIAKARVSASGRRYCMIGGVYTVPQERKKGRAALLVSQIIKRSQAHGVNNFCLYAKQENAAALALYKSLGFVPRGEYLLVYY